MTKEEKFYEIRNRAVNMWLNGSEPNRRWWLERIAEILKVDKDGENIFVVKD